METALKELLQFLQLGARTDIKEYALQQVFQFTASEESVKLIIGCPEALRCLLTLLSDTNKWISSTAAKSLVNITAIDDGVPAVLDLKLRDDDKKSGLEVAPENIIKTSLTFILDPNSHIADECCMILSNLTRFSRFVDKIVDLIEDSGVHFEKLINVFTKNKYNTKDATLHHLGSVLSNLSQNARIRRYILDRCNGVVHRLISFIEYKDSEIRRRGVIGTLKNCCFDTEHHSWLLREVDILPRLLLPLAGNTEYDAEDNEKLPLDLQYLPEDKLREEVAEIRCMLLEAITQLCAIKENREYVRDKNTYIILRELHKWEKDRAALVACENLVDLMIRTEEEINADNLKELHIPEDVLEKVEKMHLEDVAQ